MSVGEFVGSRSAQMVEIPQLLYRVGDKLLLQDPPEGEFTNQDLWPEGRRKVQLLGLTPIYQAPKYKTPGQFESTITLEWIIVGSKNFAGKRVQSHYTIPKAWDDPRSLLGQVAKAYLGHVLEDGEPFDLKGYCIGRQVIEIEFIQKISGAGNPYMKAVGHFALPDDDDEAPIEVGVFAGGASSDDDGVPDDFLVGDDDGEEIPF
jgi:hypothetical protein